ncbi:MAG: methyltransferase domain-containing protein [Anaerolineae bacterium]|nr:methyltransferase domain-containing protein [Anaerolineae bacterium]
MPNQPPICSYEDSSWRTEFWRGREYEDRAERIALARMLPPRGARLCEIGAGFGRLAEFYLGYEHIILLDYARSMLRDAREQLSQNSRLTPHLPRITFVVADLYNLPLADDALDTAVTVRVLHHVADIPRAFAQVARVVRPAGTYLTDFANKRHLKAILRYTLTRRAPNPFTHEPYEFVKLNFDFHPRYIEEHLRAVNFIVRERRSVSFFRLALLKRLVPVPILAALDGILQSPLSNLYLSPSVFFRAESCKPGVSRLNTALWRCPACHSTTIVSARDALVCQTCERVYPIVDGIIDFKAQM